MKQDRPTAFKPGQSGNPKGRPRINDHIKVLARAKGPDAFKRVVTLMGSKDERVSLAAAQVVLDRAYGKATQYVDVTSRRELSDMTDAELAAIAAGRSAGDSSSEESAHEPDQLH